MTTPARTSKQTAILWIVCLCYFMVILDNSIIFTGVPSIQSAMHFSSTGLAWVQDAYVLVFGGLLLLGSRAGDLVGRKRMFLLSLVLFGTASFLVGVAPTQWWLIASRALQGIGAAILAPSSLALLTASFEEGQPRSKAIAAYSAVAGIGASAGLVVGGILTSWISWRAVFFLNVPIGIAMWFAARRYLDADTVTKQGRFDFVGAITATLGMTGIVYAVIESAEAGWGSLGTLIPLVAGVVLLGVLVLNESRVEQPIIPLRLFADRRRTGAYVTRLLYLGAMIGFFFFITQYLQEVLGYSPLQAGFAFLPMSAVNFAVALAVTRVINRVGSSWTLIAGVGLTLIGMAWLSRVGVASSYWEAVALPMVLIGMGQGLAFAPMTSAGLAGVSGAEAGASSGLINTFHQLGSALGLSIVTAVAATAPTIGSAQQVVTNRVGAAITGSSVLLIIALVTVIVLISRRVPDRGAPAPVQQIAAA